jgi:hypothetical protein
MNDKVEELMRKDELAQRNMSEFEEHRNSEEESPVGAYLDEHMPTITEEEAANKYGAKVSENGKALQWWTEEEEEAAKKEATAKSGEAQKSPSKTSNGSFVAVGGGGSSGTYGVVKNEDFTEYRKKRDAQIARQRAAVAAGKRAEQEERNKLLATGRYFNDGHGNIKLKKEYRAQNKDSRRGHFDKDTEHNTYADATNHAIKAAGQAAYNNAMEEGFEGVLRRQEEEKAAKGRAKTQEIVEQNEFELAQQEERKKQRGINLSKGHLAIFDGLVAAYKALDSKYNVSATHRDERRVGQLKDKNGRIIGYGAIDKKQVYADNDGIRVQNGEDGKPTVRNGFVGIGTIDTINRRLRETGNNKFKITGIIARQKIDAIGNKAEPMFYVQGIRADGTQFGKTMSMKDVYNFGKENYIGSGENDENAENNVIDTFSDVFGVRKRQEEAKMRDPKYRKSVAEAKLAEYKAENPNWLTFDERMQLQESQNQNRLAIAQLNAEQRQKAAEAARVLKELGYAINIDLAEAKSADASARSMANAKTGITNEAKYTPEQIDAEKKRAEEARKRARDKVGSRQESASSGDNRTMPTVAKDMNSITMPDGKVVKKNETYTDSRGRTMRWVGPGPKDWKIVK